MSLPPQRNRIYKRNVPLDNLHRETKQRRIQRIEAGKQILEGRCNITYLPSSHSVVEPDTESTDEHTSCIPEPTTDSECGTDDHIADQVNYNVGEMPFTENEFLRGHYSNNDVRANYESDLEENYAEVGDTSDTDDDVIQDQVSKKLQGLCNLIMFEESNISVEQVLNMVQAMKLRHCLSEIVIQSLLDYTIILAGPAFQSVKITAYDLNTFNKPAASTKTYTFYCPECSRIIKVINEKSSLNKKKSIQCSQCKKIYVLAKANKYHFVNIDLRYQIESVLKEKSLLQSVINNFNRFQERSKINDGVISDVCDTELYKNNKFIKKCVNDNKNNVVLTLNTNIDGAAMFKCTKNSLWSILSVINELNVSERFKIILNAGSWYGKTEPHWKDMKIFLKDFVEQMARFQTTAIKVKLNNTIINVFVIPLAFPCDAMARSPIGGRVTVAGYCGCFWCYIYGLYDAHAVRYPLKQLPDGNFEEFVARTHELYLIDADRAEEKNYIERVVKGNKSTRTTEMGVKGFSALIDIDDIDIIWSLPPEYLHLLLLGAVKDEWDELNKKECAHFLKKKIRDEVDELLISIRPTSDMYRVPQKLLNRGCWKSADWLYWLLFYGPTCLEDKVHKDSLHLMLLLCKSSYTLLQSNISRSDIEICEKDIFEFVKGCQNLYGISFMTSNIHSLLHLTTTVEKCGPLWSVSAFPFESKLAQIKRRIKKPSGVGDQIADNVAEYYNFRTKIIKMEMDAGRKGVNIPTAFCLKKIFNRDKPVANYIISEEEAMVNNNNNMIEKNKFEKCYYNGKFIHSKLYSKCKKTDNTIIQLTDGSIVQVNYFSLTENKLNMHVEKLNTVTYEKCGVILHHLLIVESREDEAVVSVINFKQKMLHIELKAINKEYVCLLPNFPDVK